jgi:hypothetical protein
MMKPIASLSLDLDNKWCYLRTHGVAGWEKYPSYLHVAVPRVLRTCAGRDLRLTCFVVGRDAERDENRDLLATVAAAGHEIGNHSHNHYPWMHTLGRELVEAEITDAEQQIERATGRRPVGFRSPAYSLSADTLEVLAERGYEYDATTLPTYLGPLARWYFRRTASPEAADEADRRELFGTFCDGLRPIRPYVVDTAAGPLVEIPITTLPLIRLPIHMTYLWYLWQLSPRLARFYLRLALSTCRLVGVGPSVILHPLDLLGGEDEPELSFFPGMRLSRETKQVFVEEFFDQLAAHYDVRPVRAQADDVWRQSGVQRPGRPTRTIAAAQLAVAAAAVE